MPTFYSESNTEQVARSSLHCLSKALAVFSAKKQNSARHNNPKNRQPTKKVSKKSWKKLFFLSTVELGLAQLMQSISKIKHGWFLFLHVIF